MEDFIFGTLASDALRLEHVRGLRSGITHHFNRQPYAPKPGQPVQIELSLGPAQIFDRAWVYWSIDGQEPSGSFGKVIHGQALALEKIDPTWDTLEWGYLQRYRGLLPAYPEGTVVRYYLTAGSINGQEVRSDGGKMFAYYVTNLGLPNWAREAVIYQIMPDRFYPGAGKAWRSPKSLSGFFGGTLKGITEKLGYIAELGANVIWLTPIFPSPTHHGYDATDLFSIEPRLGTKEDLKTMLDEAHGLGMRVLLDFVPNHWSSLHPLFQEAITDRQSPRVDWYLFKHWPDDYESFFGVKELPQINLRDPDARQHFLDAAAFWLEFGVDGYRLDYAVGPTPDFWADFRRTCVKVNPEAWTFGEVVEPSDSQRNFYGLLNGALDFMLLEALRQIFAFRRWEAHQFLTFLDRHEAYFPADFSRPSFLDNHDMNRFLWAVQNDLTGLKLAALCQFTLVGPPVIYYGTEVGLSQERDVRQAGRGLPEESRLPMLWGEDQNQELLAYYRQLIEIRRQESGLIHGDRQTLPTGKQVIAYTRGNGESTIAVVINLADVAQSISLPGKWHTILLSSQPGATLAPGELDSELELPAQCGVILKR